MQPFSFENLPKSWEWKSIGEIADAVRGVAFPGDETSKEQFENSIACLTTSGVQDEVNWRSRRFIPKSFLSNERQILKDGDLLVSTANSKELVGKSCLVKKPNYPCTFGAFVTVLRPNTNFDSSLFAYWMRSKEVLRWCFQNSSNTTNISNLRTSELLTLEIPFPKPDEQKRIAGILDKADRLRRQRRFAQTLSDSFLQSVFIKMFGDPVNNPKHWNSCHVNELCSVIVDCPHTTPNYSEKKTHFPCIRTSDIQNGLVDWSTTKYVSEDEYNVRIARYKPLTGDVLYTREGERFGLAAQVPNSSTVCLGQRMMLLKANSKNANNEFLCALMNSPLIYRQASNLVGGSTSPHVNVGDIRSFDAIKPPLPLQEKFAEIVQKFERVRRQQREATRQAEHLFRTLLHRAFRGEL